MPIQNQILTGTNSRSRTGSFSYGPLGIAIIKATIVSILRLQGSSLQSTLEDVIAAQVANSSSGSTFWKSANGRCLDIFDIIDFVIQPHITNHLIMEDLGKDEKGVQEIRLMSYDYGLLFNQEDDGLTDRALEDVRADVANTVSSAISWVEIYILMYSTGITALSRKFHPVRRHGLFEAPWVS